MAFIHGKIDKPVCAEDIESMQAMLLEMADIDHLMLEYQRTVTSAAIVLRKEREYSKAIAYYRKALAVNGQNDHILFNLARVYFETGMLNEARMSLREALDLNPGFEMARRFLRYLDASRENST